MPDTNKQSVLPNIFQDTWMVPAMQDYQKWFRLYDDVGIYITPAPSSPRWGVYVITYNTVVCCGRYDLAKDELYDPVPVETLYGRLGLRHFMLNIGSNITLTHNRYFENAGYYGQSNKIKAAINELGLTFLTDRGKITLLGK